MGPPSLRITIHGEFVGELSEGGLERFGPTVHRADFHCVATWSVRDLAWTGVPLAKVLGSFGIGERTATHVVARAADRRRGHFEIGDALHPTVIVATHLNGEPLGSRHGGPLRLIAPQHYGYKSIKHLVGIDLNSGTNFVLGKEHLRGRVTHEERHPTLPSWLVKLPYRCIIPLTARLADYSCRRARIS